MLLLSNNYVTVLLIIISVPVLLNLLYWCTLKINIWSRPFMVLRFQKKDFHCFVEWFKQLFYNYVVNISVIQCIYLKNSLMYGSFWDSCHLIKNFRFDIICDIIQEPQALPIWHCASGFIVYSEVIKYLFIKYLFINCCKSYEY